MSTATQHIRECDQASVSLMLCVEKRMPQEEAAHLQAHLRTCAECRQKLADLQKVEALLGEAYDGIDLSQSFDEGAGRRLASLRAIAPDARPEIAEDPVFHPGASARRAFFGGAPWWLVSVALHALVVVLAGLISMAVALPPADDPLVTVTELSARPTIEQIDKKQEDAASALHSAKETPPIDPTSKDQCDVIVPPELLARAELGNHFETINPDRPDTQSAFGNPEAQMFHSMTGSDEPAGGGGNQGALLEDMIGAGGASSPGSGGGWGGGSGMGNGAGDGSGRGSFGNRTTGGRRAMVKRHGGSQKTEDAVNLALEWLARHQEADGHWNAQKFGAFYPVDVGMTALPLLAFLGAGHTEKVGKYKDNVIRAVAWLRSKVRDDGSMQAHAYEIAIATMALAEATGMANIPETRAAAQKAINYCTEIHQQGDGSEKGGWRYQPKSVPDISVTGWFVMALKSAKVAGLQVNPMSFEGADKAIGTMEVKNVAAHGVDTAYGPPSMFWYQPIASAGKDMNGAEVGGPHNARTTAIGVLCRQFLGHEKEKLQSTVDLVVELGGTPKWTADKPQDHGFLVGHTDLYYWYYTTLAVFQRGGDTWKKWNAALKPALVDNQSHAGDDTGSWDPVGSFSGSWGRVGQTALGALCLEVYYRYAKLNDGPGGK